MDPDQIASTGAVLSVLANSVDPDQTALRGAV